MMCERSKMRVYLAGPRAEWGRVTYWDEELRKLPGVECTHTWIDSIRALGHSSDEKLSAREQNEAAKRCLSDVEAADIVWLLMPSVIGFGSLIETGFALARGKRIVVSGQHVQNCIFTALATRRFDTDHHALGAIAFWSSRLQPSESDLNTVGSVP